MAFYLRTNDAGSGNFYLRTTEFIASTPTLTSVSGDNVVVRDEVSFSYVGSNLEDVDNVLVSSTNTAQTQEWAVTGVSGSGGTVTSAIRGNLPFTTANHTLSFSVRDISDVVLATRAIAFNPPSGFTAYALSDAQANKTLYESFLAGLGTIPANSQIVVPNAISGNAMTLELSSGFPTGRVSFASYIPPTDVTFNIDYRPGDTGVWETIPVTLTQTIDLTPNAISFTPVTGATINTLYTSNSQTITGINAAALVEISAGGEYRLNGGTWTSVDGYAYSGDTVEVRVTSSPSGSTTTTAILSVGTSNFNFEVTTAADAVTTPDQFTFTDQTGGPLNQYVESNTIAIAGINTGSPLTISGGEYSINSGGWASAPATVYNGDTVKVRVLTSSSFLTGASTTLTIGGVSDTFTVTTAAEDTTPDAFNFADQSGVDLATLVTSNIVTITGINSTAAVTIVNGEYRVQAGAWTSSPGSITNGQTLQIRHTSSGSYSTSTDTTVTVGGVSDTMRSVTVAAPGDFDPDPFFFSPLTDVALSQEQVSNSITVTGIDTATTISIVGGEYSVNNGGWTSVTAVVSLNDTVRVRHISANTFSTSVTTLLSIGDQNGEFVSTTLSADTEPDQFSFVDVYGNTLNTLVVSKPITLAGTNSPAVASIVGGEYSVNGGEWISAPSNVVTGDVITLRTTSPETYNTTKVVTFTVDVISADWRVVTLPSPTPKTPIIKKTIRISIVRQP